MLPDVLLRLVYGVPSNVAYELGPKTQKTQSMRKPHGIRQQLKHNFICLLLGSHNIYVAVRTPKSLKRALTGSQSNPQGCK